ncbi:MAG: metal ABC transporter solute-binding protein, Zn/Mn family [Spirochaetia bacterium]
MKKYCIVLVMLLAAASLFAGGARDEAEENGIRVFTSIVPMQYFADRIISEAGEAEAIVKPGMSPATYDPTPRQVARLENGDALFTVGVPFERSFVPDIRERYPSLRIIDTTEGIRMREIDEHHRESGDEEDHGHEDEEHGQGNLDPHVWTSPRRAARIAGNIGEALMEIDPDNREAYEANMRVLIQEIQQLDGEIENMLRPYQGEEVFIYHPALGYFCDDYGLEQVPIEVGGNSPGPRQLGGFIRRAEEAGARVIFIQPEFDTQSAETVAEEIGAVVAPLDILAYDYIINMQSIAQTIASAFEGE